MSPGEKQMIKEFCKLLQSENNSLNNSAADMIQSLLLKIDNYQERIILGSGISGVALTPDEEDIKYDVLYENHILHGFSEQEAREMCRIQKHNEECYAREKEKHMKYNSHHNSYRGYGGHYGY